MREEEVVKADLEVADELISDATSKLHDVLSATAVNKRMMLDIPSQYMHYCLVLLCEVYCVIV